MYENWSIEDLIDFEYFLKKEKDNNEQGENNSNKINRSIYKACIANTGSEPTRRNLLRFWLESKRKFEQSSLGIEAQFPGDAFKDIYKLTLYLYLIVLFMLGWGLSNNLFFYDGKTPVDVLIILFIVIFEFVLFIIIVAIFLIPIKFRKWFLSKYPFIFNIIIKYYFKVKRIISHNISTGQKQNFEVIAGMINGEWKIYGNIFYWLFFTMIQSGIAVFNIGLICGIFFSLTFKDLAFGWQSTWISSEQIYNLVSFLSIPWAWLPEPFIHPTASQIVGSKLILKEGIYHLAENDLASWWPFLCLSIALYGLFPRIIISVIGKFTGIILLRNFDFSFAPCEELIQSMRGPRIETVGREYKLKTPNTNNSSTISSFFSKKTAESSSEPISQMGILVIPEDLHQLNLSKKFIDIIREKFSIVIAKEIRTGLMIENTEEIIQSIISNKQPFSSVFFLQEAWHPPIKDIIYYIKETRKIIGPKTSIIIFLIGKISGESNLLPVDKNDYEVWKNEISKMADPWIRLENFGGE